MSEASNRTKAILDDIQGLIKRYVYLPNDETALVLSLWAMHTWAVESFDCTPYMYIHSPTKRSGKTRLIEVMELVIKNPMRASSITDSALFRTIEMISPTLLLDEVDAVFYGRKNESLRGVLNSGYRRGGYIWRVKGGEPYRYNTYGPKLMAGISNGYLPDTIADRCVPINLIRKPKSAKVEAFYLREVQESSDLQSILTRIDKWQAQMHGKLYGARIENPIDKMTDRQWEISIPLLVIARLASVEDRARKALEVMFEDAALDIDDEADILKDVVDILEESGQSNIFTDQILDELNGEDEEDGPWTPERLAGALKSYGVHSTTVRVRQYVRKGYKGRDLITARNNYIS